MHVSDKEGKTPAHYAAAFKHMKIYEKLLETGANEKIIDKVSNDQFQFRTLWIYRRNLITRYQYNVHIEIHLRYEIIM